MFTMPKPYPKEFRDDVVRVALNREPGVRIKDVAADFGITESCLGNWLACNTPVRLGNWLACNTPVRRGYLSPIV